MTSEFEEKIIKKAIKTLLKKSNFQYIDLATYLGVSLPTVRRMLTKDHITLDRVIKICGFLNISFHDLIEYSKFEKIEYTFLTIEQEQFFTHYPATYTYLRFLARGYIPKEIEKKFKISSHRSQFYLENLKDLNLIKLSAKGQVTLNVKWPAIWNFPGPLQKKYFKKIHEKFLEKLLQKSLSTENEQNHFFMLDSLLLKQNSYSQYLIDMKELYQKYHKISKFEVKTEKKEELNVVSALFGIDVYDVLTEVMGDIKDV